MSPSEVDEFELGEVYEVPLPASFYEDLTAPLFPAGRYRVTDIDFDAKTVTLELVPSGE